MRIGLFGGTFAPVTIGHLAAALLVQKMHRLDQVLFLPVGQHRFKAETVESHHRLAMLQLAVEPHEGLGVSTLELEASGESRTVETLRRFRQDHPEDEVFFILGADLLEQLAVSWHDSAGLLAENQFILLTRPGYDVAQSLGQFPLLYRFQKKLTENLTVFQVPISSSLIRNHLQMDMPISYLVPPQVEKYIREQGLFSASRDGKASR